LAGGKKKINILELAKARDEKLAKGNEHYIKMKELEDQAESIDYRIMEECDHPSKYLKVKEFTNSIPQQTIWLCTICYQAIDLDPQKIDKERSKKIESLFRDVCNEMPE